MHRSIKNLLMASTIVLVNLVFFQNCAPNKLAVNQPNSAFEEGSTVVNIMPENPTVKTINACPQYVPVLCEKDESLTAIEDPNGCPRYTCIRQAGPVCPAYQSVLCSEEEDLVINEDKYGCSYPICKPKDKPVPKPPVEKPEPKQCPQYMPPLCKDGQSLIIVPGADGCDITTCGVPRQKPELPQCPEVLPIPCENGKLFKTTNKDGCSQVVCIQNTNPTCPQYRSPSCKGPRQRLNIVEDSHSCPVPVCEELEVN